MKFKTSLLIGAAAVAATSLLAVTSHAKNLRWKMQSTWGCLLYTSPSPRDQ